MRKYIFMAIIFAIPQIMLAQKEMKNVSYKEFNVPIEIMQYPSDPLGEEYQTYQLEVNLPDNINYTGVGRQLIETLQIAGFQEVSSEGDLLIRFNVYEFEFRGPEVISTNSEGEDCALRIYYTYKYRLTLKDQKTKKYLSENDKSSSQLGGNSDEMWSKSYRTRKSLEEDRVNIEQFKREILDNILVVPCRESASWWTAKYGKQIIKRNLPMQRIYEKDYYETYFFLYRSYSLQQFFSSNVRIGNPPAPSHVEIDEFIRYNNEVIAKEKNMALKGKNTVEAMCYCNIGWIYYACDDFDKACEYGEKALAAGEMKVYANNLIKSSKTAADILIKNGVNSRYLIE